ncbi:Intradiol ring-cleavage dioxygenase [Aspergillus californicus]
MFQQSLRLFIFLLLGSIAWAHGNHQPPFPGAKSALKQCDSAFEKRGHDEQAAQRREQRAKSLRRELGLAEDRPLLRKRSIEDAWKWGNKSHLSDLGLTAMDMEPARLFANSSCVLAPETIFGPYYALGEHVRSNLREDQPGVNMFVELEFFDIETCKPLQGVVIDWWNANSSGVYSGAVADYYNPSLPANGDGSEDPGNINTTFLRWIQTTDSNGIVHFATIFPGHYAARATHTHLTAHLGGNFFPNGTFISNETAHTTQIFFDEHLRGEIYKYYPYTLQDGVPIVLDSDYSFIGEAASAGYDPYLQYVLLGNNVTDGIFGWMRMGINTSASYPLTAVSRLGEDGGTALRDLAAYVSGEVH